MKAYLLSLLLIFVLLHTTVPTTASLHLPDELSGAPIKKLFSSFKKLSNKAEFIEPTKWKQYLKNLLRKKKSSQRPSNKTETIESICKKATVKPFCHSKHHKSTTTTEDRDCGGCFVTHVENIDGLSYFKEYLSKYGYIKYSNSFNDQLDSRTVSAFNTYQKFFNLKATGMIDQETVQQMELLRCGVPDLNYAFHLSGTHPVSWPLGTAWFPNNRRELTYGFLPTTKIPPKAVKVFRDSFKRWSVAVGWAVNFTETAAYNAADIKIGFLHLSRHLFRVEVVGATLMVKQSYYHKVDGGGDGGDDGLAYGIVAFDNSKYWALPGDNLGGKQLWKFGVVDLETVAMHQIGHLLGLRHSSNEESVMYPSILPDKQRKVNLSKDDKEQIHKIYFSRKP